MGHGMRAAALVALLVSTGCGSAIIEPGHRGLVFDPSHGGLGREVLTPGEHRIGASARIDDYDVTYSTKSESMQVITKEGLPVEVRVEVIYRPIISELYELDTEIGPRYFEEVIEPEFRSAVRATMSTCSFMDVSKPKLEDEIEAETRQRLKGKHVEISSVVLGDLKIPPDLAAAIKERQLAEQQVAKRKAELEADALEEKAKADAAWEKQKLDAIHQAELRKIAEGR